MSYFASTYLASSRHSGQVRNCLRYETPPAGDREGSGGIASLHIAQVPGLSER